MGSVHHLTDQNFTNNDKTLKCTWNVPKPIFICFRCPNCENCVKFIPILERLAQTNMKVLWASVDVVKFRNIVNASRGTQTPITGTPTCLLYINGSPKVAYKGVRSYENISSFIDQILSKIEPPKFVGQPVRQENAPQAGAYMPSEFTQSNQKQLHSNPLNIPNRVAPHNEPWKTTK
jgi:thioredoxin-like negative regulator of GroEL